MSEPQRRLASIMFSDMVGYSAMAQRNEKLAIELLNEHRVLLRALFTQFGGREMDAVGDGFFVEFSSAVDATRCAIAIQQSLRDRNVSVMLDRHIHVRIGIHLGDVVVEGGHIVGDGVNIAARIQPLSQPGEICVSEDVARQIQNKIELPVDRLGPRTLKNISTPMTLYRIRLPWQGTASGARGASIRRGPWSTRTRLLLLVVALVVALGGTYRFAVHNVDSTSSPPSMGKQSGLSAKPRLAVLPFVNLSNDPANEYFVDGMTEELISRLSRISEIEVIARTSVMQFKGKALTVDAVAKALNVTTVLEGSVRRIGNRLRITTQLIDSKSQTHLWTENYDREVKDVFEIQSDVSLRVADALRLRLLPGEKNLVEQRGTNDLKAYEHYLQGLYQLYASTPEAFDKSLQHFDSAIKVDSTYARPHAGKANALELIGVFGLRPQRETFALAKDAALKALVLDDSVVEAWVTLGAVKVYLDLDWEGAEQAFNRALSLNPRSAVANDWVSINYLCPKGMHDRATTQIRRSVELDPQSPSVHHDAGWVFWCAGHYAEAIGYFNSAIEREPNLSFAYDGLALSYSALARHDEAIEAALTQVKLTSAADFPLGTLGFVYAQGNKRVEAEQTLARLKGTRNIQEIEPLALALLNAGLGDHDAAFELLNRSFKAGNYQRLMYINGGNYFSPLRTDPRFRALTRKLGLT